MVRTHVEDGVTLEIETPDGLTPGQSYWRADVKVYNPQEGQGTCLIFARAFDQQGQRLTGQRVEFGYNGTVVPAVTEAKPMVEKGDANLFMPGHDGWDPSKGLGPYWVRMGTGIPSERVRGMDLPFNQHFEYQVFFTLTTWQSGSGGQTGGGQTGGGQTGGQPSSGLEAAIRAADATVQKIVLNPGGALQKQMLKDGCTPTSGEFSAMAGGQTAVCQHAENTTDDSEWIYWAFQGQFDKVFRLKVG